MARLIFVEGYNINKIIEVIKIPLKSTYHWRKNVFIILQWRCNYTTRYKMDKLDFSVGYWNCSNSVVFGFSCFINVYCYQIVELEDTKGVIRIRKSKKESQFQDKKINNVVQNIT
jgi:uncharacterized membrane protein